MSGLQVDPTLRAFVEDELLPDVDLDPEVLVDLAACRSGSPPRIAELLARRDELQARIDAWHPEHGAGYPDDYEAFLTEIGYLAPEPSPPLRVAPSTRRSPRSPARSWWCRPPSRATR